MLCCIYYRLDVYPTAAALLPSPHSGFPILGEDSSWLAAVSLLSELHLHSLVESEFIYIQWLAVTEFGYTGSR